MHDLVLCALNKNKQLVFKNWEPIPQLFSIYIYIYDTIAFTNKASKKEVVRYIQDRAIQLCVMLILFVFSLTDLYVLPNDKTITGNHNHV